MLYFGGRQAYWGLLADCLPSSDQAGYWISCVGECSRTAEGQAELVQKGSTGCWGIKCGIWMWRVWGLDVRSCDWYWPHVKCTRFRWRAGVSLVDRLNLVMELCFFLRFWPVMAPSKRMTAGSSLWIYHTHIHCGTHLYLYIYIYWQYYTIRGW